MATDKTGIAATHADHDDRQNNALARLAYSPHDGAQVLSISRSKFYELIAAGDLRVVKLGSRTLVPHSELVRFLASLDAPRKRKPVVKEGSADKALPSSNT
jgi:excisionase family DNA binding protein